ncbi:diguanylate cyclase domain-containing protein [Paucimonas lemoignei]|uniref:diguanylate cyclase domain-containing protein n=1 Tax=Paucimonas lemoignei TaxID=29443 RepID=UPI001FB3566B|nr:diguanylate cyclase [Paucimonas lemoignei]
MVVDDSVDNAHLLVEALKISGFCNVSWTNDSRDVYAMHAKNHFDLILLDMHMPYLNGLQIMEQLRGIEQDRYLPVLAITGDSEFKIAALQAGARDFLMKPFDIIELDARVRNMLEVRLLYNAVQEQSRIQRELAMHDSLTGLPNRRLLMDRLHTMMQHAQRSRQHLAVLYLDLDGFKPVNDQMGHQAGDELLKMVAQRLLHTVRRDDTVSRLGGDEFVLLLADVADIATVERLAEKVLRYLSSPFIVQDRPVKITASIGIATYSHDIDSDCESLLADADMAMYQAKNRGKSRYFMLNKSAVLA